MSGSAFTAVRESPPEVVLGRAATQENEMPVYGSIDAEGTHLNEDKVELSRKLPHQHL